MAMVQGTNCGSGWEQGLEHRDDTLSPNWERSSLMASTGGRTIQNQGHPDSPAPRANEASSFLDGLCLPLSRVCHLPLEAFCPTEPEAARVAGNSLLAKSRSNDELGFGVGWEWITALNETDDSSLTVSTKQKWSVKVCARNDNCRDC